MPRRTSPDGPPRHSHPPQPVRQTIPAHKILGLSSREEDAVRVIEVASVLLSQWRRTTLGRESLAEGHPVFASQAAIRIRAIEAAREAMLERIHARLTGSKTPASG